MTVTRANAWFRAIAVVFLVSVAIGARGDEVLYRYNGDVLPFDSGAGWDIFDACDPQSGCMQRIEDGHFVIDWTMGGDVMNLDHPFIDPPGDFWVEWQFRSNRAFIPTQPGCDGIFIVGNPYDDIWMHGNLVANAEGGSGFAGLPLDEFHSYRFERRVGNTYTFAVNGHVFIGQADDPVDIIGFLQMQGLGSCTGNERNMWDHVWYGTLSDGEATVSSDPPGGVVDANSLSNLDRFTVSFDQAAFVYVDEIAVEVIPPEAVAPSIRWTRRLVNGEPDTIEVVLDRPLALGATTRFVFDTGGAGENVVEYTYLSLGACCAPDGSCVENEETECGSAGGEFFPGENCEGDADEDALDGQCGDQCPSDPFKTALGQCGCGIADLDSDLDGVADCLDGCPEDPEKTAPGQCGCGTSETDSDADTVADCNDVCPQEDDTVDDDQNGTPDCAQFQPIPTASTWGLVIMAFLLLIGAKLRFGSPKRAKHGQAARGSHQLAR
jgi:hypothetical protein